VKRIVALTDAKIAAARTASQRDTIYDPAMPGLAVRINPGGRKVFVYGARFPGTDNFARRELGAFGPLNLADARAKAKRWADWIARGIDPREAEERERQDAATKAALAAGNTFAAVVADYVKRALRGKRKAEVVEREIRNELIPHWGAKPIADITRRDVVALIEKIVDRPAPAYARNIFQHICGVFNFAISRDVYGLGNSPCDRIKPRELIGKKKDRTRVLSDDELFAVWRVATRLGYPYGAALQTLLLTGCRASEVTDARWREFNLPQRLWTIPAERFKTDDEHIVPLSGDLLDLLNALPRWPHAGYLFSADGKAPIVFRNKWKRRFDRRVLRTLQGLARKRGKDPNDIGVASWQIHDLRRTVRTRLSALRVPDHIAELVIGHSRKGIARVYDLHGYETEMREALTAWAAKLRTIVNPSSAANIVRGKFGRG
jgi:integrase